MSKRLSLTINSSLQVSELCNCPERAREIESEVDKDGDGDKGAGDKENIKTRNGEIGAQLCYERENEEIKNCRTKDTFRFTDDRHEVFSVLPLTV